jgi:hypothetical protein
MMEQARAYALVAVLTIIPTAKKSHFRSCGKNNNLLTRRRNRQAQQNIMGGSL